MTRKHPITVAEGDGIGPEIMGVTLELLKEAGAELEIEKILIGEKLYLAGHPTGIKESAWESLKRTKVFLKSPITTPQGKGYRSLNVTVRGALGLYANVRPCVSYAPFIQTKHPDMDVVIIRENEEDLYTGIEYRQTPDVCQALKIISRSASERIVRYAFEYAKTYKRTKVTCFTKDNILKLSDGLFHKVFREIQEEYPEIESDHWIIDIGAAKLADTPEDFDVIVLPNLYGDILSDVAAQITGSVGIVGTSNIGDKAAMFEAIHGSAPKKAGRDEANPTGLILASVLMLVHIHQNEAASRLHNALLKTLEEGLHTQDIFKEGISKQCLGTKAFGKAISERLGKTPDTLQSVHYAPSKEASYAHHGSSLLATQRELVGVDVYLYAHDPAEKLVNKLQAISSSLTMVTNRGVKVWPEGHLDAFCVDHWRCRFEPLKTQGEIVALLELLTKGGFDVIKTENLYLFDGVAGYSNVEQKA